jgi:hypothetical protein
MGDFFNLNINQLKVNHFLKMYDQIKQAIQEISIFIRPY